MQQVEQPIDREHLEPLPDLIRVQAGRFPGTEILDLGSPAGFVGRKIAEDVPRWTVYSPHEFEDPPENLQPADLTFTKMEFEDGQLAAIVGAWIDDPIPHWSQAFLEEVFRVLAPGGRLFFLFRGPSPRNRTAPRQIPAEAVEMLEQAGFEHAAERRNRMLPDGSQLIRLRAVKPE